MEGVDVNARRWFIVYHARPGYRGYYRMSHRFKRPCNYSIWFGHPLFRVKKHLLSVLTFWINGPKKTGDWNYSLSDGYNRFAGHVFRGAYRYQVKNIGGLARPYLSSRQIYIASDSYKNPGFNWQIFPIIKIGRYKYVSSSTEYNSDEVFSATCHETAHTSHMLRMNGGIIQFMQVDNEMRESWAVAIEWFLTHLEYAERGISNYGEWNYHPVNPPIYPNDRGYQYWTMSVSTVYTTIYINLIDNVNEIFLYNTNGTPNDEVSGYTLPKIESDFLKHVYGLSSLSEQLKSHKPVGVTDYQIDYLLKHY